MQTPADWQGLPYNPISQFYRRRFGSKVYKIPVSVAQSCPNREGFRGMKTCIFCDVWGSAAYPEVRDLKLKEQIESNRDRVKNRTNAAKFLVYFQAYTNSFTKTQNLREQFEIAARCADVVGFVVGTRPDCISDAVLDLWQEYNEKLFLSVELGAQSFDNAQLKWMERGHSAEKTIWAIERVKAQTSVDLGVHLMFGFPGETEQQLIDTAQTLNGLPIENVKLHNLHVLKNTPLADIYERGEFSPIEKAEYADRVISFLQHLRPDIAVHRLAVLSSRSDELIAPQWTSKKMEIYQYIIDRFRDQGAFQGQLFSRPTESRISLPLISESLG